MTCQMRMSNPEQEEKESSNLFGKKRPKMISLR